jgi:hypothetical protein
MEQPHHPAESADAPVLRLSPGTGAVVGPDGRRLALASGVTSDAQERPAIGDGPA